MRRILVPVDGSPSSGHAVRHVAELKQSGMDLHVQLLHVVQTSRSDDFPPVALTGLGQSQESDVERAFAPARKLLDDAAIPCSTHVAAGDPAIEIATYARAHECSEIVMGTRGMGLVKSLVLGSVATKVLHLVKVPVTLVK